ncbi:MAG TPA: hypothetical protein VMS11_15300 [Solirubrobacterales bacterium]|nr:hypothetical protein [Solirubrobacterales bacterium]
MSGGTMDSIDGAALDARLDQALAAIAAGAEELDREPRFPAEAFRALAGAGALEAPVGAARADRSVLPEWRLLRRVAAADASVGRILDGHLNAVERLEVSAGGQLRESELSRLRGGRRLLGVWGADPGPGEGSPARLRSTGPGMTLSGVKTFCSGAGGVDAALVMVGSDDGEAPRLALVDCAEIEIDRDWYRAAGLRASESHRVVFHDAEVIGLLGDPGELGRQPWFSRDAMRTAASWIGMFDAAAEGAFAELARARAEDPLGQLAAGRIEALRGTIEGWFLRGAEAATHRGELKPVAIAMRAEIDRAAKALLETAAAACGSHPFVTGGRLDRGRRDLETFLLQHRLDPLLAGLGAERLRSR